MQDLLFNLLLFITPLVYIPWITSPFEAGKVIFAEILIIILLYLQKRPKKHTLNYFEKALILIFLISLLSLITNFSTVSIFGNSIRRQGLLLLWLLLAFSWVSSRVKIKLNKKFVYFSFVVSFLAILFVPTTLDGRSYGLLGEPNSLAGYFAFLWPFLFHQIKANKKKFFAPIVTILVILFSGSRSALIALAAQLTLLKFNLVAAIALILISTFLPTLDTQGKYQVRTRIWQTATTGALERPLTGYGFGNTKEAIDVGAVKLQNSLRYEYVDSAHNIFIDWFAQGGIMALALLLFLNYLALSKLRGPHLMSFLGLLTVMLFNPVSVALLVPYWWLIGHSAYDLL